MVSARDVAQYILDRCGAMPAMKLQKLLYYCQAWSLVWDQVPLFPDRIEAWANGPVVPNVWQANRYEYIVDRVSGGRSSKISSAAADTINAVLNHYGKKSASELSALTHSEAPWRDARNRAHVPSGERSDEVIGTAAILKYYSERSLAS
jgi:uncharacterized phage-associated protein